MKYILTVFSLLSFSAFGGLSISIDGGESSVVDISSANNGNKSLQLTITSSGGENYIYRSLRFPKGISSGNVGSTCVKARSTRSSKRRQ